MARFIQCPGAHWEAHPSTALLEATVRCGKGSVAEFLLEDGDGLDVFEAELTVQGNDKAGILDNPAVLGPVSYLPLKDAAKPSNPRHRWFALRSDDFKVTIVYAKKGGSAGPDWAKPLRVVWSSQSIGAATDSSVHVVAGGASAKPLVLQHINRALGYFSGHIEPVMLWGAAKELGVERNLKGASGKPINCSNEPLAYAEHYLIARALVADDGGHMGTRLANHVKARAMVLGWDGIKASYWAVVIGGSGSPATWLLRKELEQKLRAGVCPVSVPSPYSVRWGLAGCNDGLFHLKASDLPIRHITV